MQFEIKEEIEVIQDGEVIDIVYPKFIFDVEIRPYGENEWIEKCELDWNREDYPEYYNNFIQNMKEKLIDKFFTMCEDDIFYK